jgi:hypothetical protein
MTIRHSRNRIGAAIHAGPGAYLSDDDIARVAPSVFAVTAHDSRSAGFKPIPTSAILVGLRKEGFDVVQARQSRSRDASRIDFTKHMLRLRHRDSQLTTRARAIGDVFPEVVLVNANDGSSSYVLSAGLFRLVCLNGMTVSDRSFPGVRVTHWGDVAGKVIEGSYTVLEESRQAVEHVSAWSAVTLSPPEQDAFAQSARILRFGHAEGVVNTPITAAQLLRANRTADTGASLWHTFNRVQENVIRGGLSGLALDANNRSRRVTSRPVNGIDQDQRLNRALWHLAAEMARHKAA